MKKTITKIAMILLVIAMALSITGCGEKTPPETGPTQSPPANPTTPAEQSPTSPAEQSPPTSPISGPSLGNSNENPELGGNIQHGSDTEELPPIIYSEYYYFNGFSDETSFYFYEDGSVDIEDSENYESGEYVIDGDEISITLDGEEVMLLYIINPVTLEAAYTEAIYTLEGALDNELVMDEYYYLYMPEETGTLRFYDDGTVEAESEFIDGGIAEAEYYVNGNTVTVEYDGETAEVEIVNSYILQSEEGIMFIRLP